MLAQRGQMLGGTGAAIGDEQKIVGQFQRVSPAVIRFLDAGVAVAIAVEEVTGDGHGAEISDDGGQTELQHFVFGEIAARDVGGGISQFVEEVIERLLGSSTVRLYFRAW